jgi:hypothetical protein
VGDHQQAAQGLSLLPGASPGVLPHPPRLGAFEKEDEMNDNSEMMKMLETIADRLVDIHLSNGRQFDELNRKLEALLAVEAGDQLPLFAIAAAAPASVVPNEDEAMPVVEEMPVLAGKDKKRTKKSPTPWSKMCPKAEAFAAAVTRAKNQIPPLQYRLDNDQLTPSERADLQRRVDTLTTKGKAAKKEYNARIKELGYVHPPSKSGKAKKATN